MSDEEKFDVEKAFAELTAKIDKLIPEEKAELDEEVETAEEEAETGDDYDAQKAIQDLNEKVDKLLAQPRNRTVKTKRVVPAAPARRTAKPTPEPVAEPPRKRRRGWFPE